MIDKGATISDVVFLGKLLHNQSICVIASHHIIIVPNTPIAISKMFGKASQFISDSNCFGHVWRLYIPGWGKKGNTTIPRTCHKDPTRHTQDCQVQAASLAEAKCSDITDRPPTGHPKPQTSRAPEVTKTVLAEWTGCNRFNAIFFVQQIQGHKIPVDSIWQKYAERDVRPWYQGWRTWGSFAK